MPMTFHAGAAKALAKLPKKDALGLMDRLEAIAADPGAHQGASVKPLKGAPKGRFRVRHGDYRAIYIIAPEGIIILAVGHRREIYE